MAAAMATPCALPSFLDDTVTHHVGSWVDAEDDFLRVVVLACVHLLSIHVRIVRQLLSNARSLSVSWQYLHLVWQLSQEA